MRLSRTPDSLQSSSSYTNFSTGLTSGEVHSGPFVILTSDLTTEQHTFRMGRCIWLSIICNNKHCTCQAVMCIIFKLYISVYCREICFLIFIDDVLHYKNKNECKLLNSWFPWIYQSYYSIHLMSAIRTNIINAKNENIITHDWLVDLAKPLQVEEKKTF